MAGWRRFLSVDESRIACFATGLSVPYKPFVTGGGSHFFELIWDIVAGAEVHLVGSLTTERRVRKTRVVLAHIERNEFPHRVDGVEGVQVQPPVFEHSPPRLDQRVGVGDLSHGEKSLEETRIDQFIDGTVEVFDSTVRENSWSLVEEATCGAEQEFGRDRDPHAHGELSHPNEIGEPAGSGPQSNAPGAGGGSPPRKRKFSR